MISAAGIKDQELTIIVSMMLIELALLRLSRFKRLALLDTQGLKLLVALHPRVWRGTISHGQEASSPGGNHNHGTLGHLLRMTVISRGFHARLCSGCARFNCRVREL